MLIKRPAKQTDRRDSTCETVLGILTSGRQAAAGRYSAGTQDRQRGQKSCSANWKHELWQRKIWVKPEQIWDKPPSSGCTKSAKEHPLRHRPPAATAVRGKRLTELDRRFIMQTVAGLPCNNSTKNRCPYPCHFEQAVREWEWLDSAPKLTLYREPKSVSFDKPVKAQKLLGTYWPPLSATTGLAAFSVSTGLRQRNALDLKWEQVDLARRTAWINADQAKGEQSPFRSTKPHSTFYSAGREILCMCLPKPTAKGCVSAAPDMEKLPKRAGHQRNFQWHDLRHARSDRLIQRGVDNGVEGNGRLEAPRWWSATPTCHPSICWNTRIFWTQFGHSRRN